MVAVPFLHHIVVVLNIGSRTILFAHKDLNGIVHVIFGNSFYSFGHGGREQPDPLQSRCLVENGINILLETHIEHLICLIQDHPLDRLKLDRFSVDQIEQSTRSSHYNLCPLFQLADLIGDIGSSVDRCDIGIVLKNSKRFQVACNLHTKLSGRTDYQSLGGPVAKVYMLD